MDAKVPPRLSVHKTEHFLLLLKRVLGTHQSQELCGRDGPVATSGFSFAVGGFAAFAYEGIVQDEVGFYMCPVMRTVVVATILFAITVLADGTLALWIIGVETVGPKIAMEL